MSSDISGTVVGIQGEPIDAEVLTSSDDGYVLTWDNMDGYWVARPVSTQQGLRKDYFISSGVWTCPIGVTNVLLIGCGGGGGGSSGGGNANEYGGGGGGGAIQQTSYASVIPGTQYTVTIGTGGSGATGTGGNSVTGNDGSPTTFSNLFSAIGAGAGYGSYGGCGGLNFATGQTNLLGSFNMGSNFSWGWVTTAGVGAPSYVVGTQAGATQHGQLNFVGGYSGGTTPTSGSATGGGGGGAGPQGSGGSGGVSGSAGTSGGINTGAGGGGGGQSLTTTGGNGGSGGSGYLYIIY